jgi:hypothetical protein
VPFSRLPHDAQTLRSGASGVSVATGSWAGGCTPAGFPQEAQNLASLTIAAPQEAQTGSGTGAGISAGPVITTGAGMATFSPQLLQNLSSGRRRVLQVLQAGVSGSVFTPGSSPPASSACDAPQFRQNFAVSDTRFPHSGQ